MATYTDDFNRADSTSLGANWIEDDDTADTIQIVSNQVRIDSQDKSGVALYNNAFASNQFSEIRLKNLVGTYSNTGVVVRGSGTKDSFTGYSLTFEGPDSYGGGTLLLYRWDNDDIYNWDGWYMDSWYIEALPVNARLRLEARGRTLRGYVGESTIPFVVWDAGFFEGIDILSGKAGIISMSESATGVRFADWDDWTGGDLIDLPARPVVSLRDTFNRLSSESLGPSWVESENLPYVIQLLSDQLRMYSNYNSPGDKDGGCALYSTNVGDDQVAELTFQGSSSPSKYQNSGVTVRASGTWDNFFGYALVYDGISSDYSYVSLYCFQGLNLATWNGTYTFIDDFYVGHNGLPVGSRIRLEAQGPMIRAYIDDLEVLKFHNYRIPTGGAVGVCALNGDSAQPYIDWDDWAGGSLPSSSAPTIQYTDTFDRLDSTSLGTDWDESETVAGALEIVGNRLRANSRVGGTTRSGRAFYKTDLGSGNHFSQLTFRLHSGVTSDSRLLVRGTAALASLSGYAFGYNVTSTSTRNLTLYRLRSNVTNTIDSVSLTSTLADGAILRLDVHGQDLRGYLNNVEVISAPALGLASGSVGFQVSPLSGTGVGLQEWDDWAAGALGQYSEPLEASIGNVPSEFDIYDSLHVKEDYPYIGLEFDPLAVDRMVMPHTPLASFSLLTSGTAEGPWSYELYPAWSSIDYLSMLFNKAAAVTSEWSLSDVLVEHTAIEAPDTVSWTWVDTILEQSQYAQPPVTVTWPFTASESTDTFTAPGHDFEDGDAITFEGPNLPGGVSAGTVYYVIGVSGNTFQVSTTPGGTVVDILTDGNGSVYLNTGGIVTAGGTTALPPGVPTEVVIER